MTDLTKRGEVTECRYLGGEMSHRIHGTPAEHAAGVAMAFNSVSFG